MIVFFGTPLLDIIAKVDHDFLKKYNLKPDNAIRATPELEGVFKDIFNFNPILQPGGSVTNTARVFQWASQKSYPMFFIGPIGDDYLGKIIENTFIEEGINSHIVEVKNEKTGTCAVLLTDENRSMVTHLGASKFFSIDNLDENLWKKISEAKYLYLSEYFSFAKISNIETTNAKDLLIKANELFKNKPLRILIMTRGRKSLLIQSENRLEEFDAPQLEEEKVVDTNGAGDAFVGGFLSQFVKNNGLLECVRCGIWAAQEIIQNHGCKFNSKLVYNN
ncbi:hypothetical protein NQ314_002742 [Rhamnusium bicolor]|uniref:Adenosine kinase n=1 Tax=Rhamnusium bicolor TaxID=1586634 RepID=A0AAV8ZPC3_9CUCU|nr:hypothetical protein NQ314_002742 [Rhamnusium bicolor]